MEIFNQIRNWNKQFGAKFTLYIYTKGNDFQIESIPERFRSEFIDAAEYLKFGFHSTSNDFQQSMLQNERNFPAIFQYSNVLIDRFSGGGSRSRILRLDRYYAKSEWQSVIVSDVDILLAPDDDRPAYWLSDSESQSVRKNGTYFFKSQDGSMIEFWRTDHRYENMFWVWYSLETLRDQDRIVIFTHEWAMDDSIKKKIEYSLQWFNNNGYHYVN